MTPELQPRRRLARGRGGATALLATSLLAQALIPPSIADAATTWSLRKKTDGVVVHGRDKPGSDAVELRGVIHFDLPVEHVAAVLMDIPNQVHFVPNCKISQVLKRKPLGDGRVRTLVYQLNEVPVVSDRDMILDAITWPTGQGASRGWRSTFKAVSRAKPAVPDGVVRIQSLRGHWVVRSGPQGKGSTLVYTNHVELNSVLPQFVVDSVRETKMVELLVGLRKRCRATPPAPPKRPQDDEAQAKRR